MNEKSVTRPRPAKCPELEVVNVILREGLACSHEHPGYVSITDARERHWAFGTINGTWDGHQVGDNGEATAPFVDLGFDGDCEDWKAIADTIIKVCSMDIPDGLQQINAPIAPTVAERDQVMADMLEALRAALGCVRYYDGHEGCPITLQQVEDAIAKAEGRR